VTSSWFFLSTLNYDARSTTHQIYIEGGFLVFLVLDFLDPLLSMACTSSFKTPFLQLKECKLVNNYKCKDSRNITEVAKFIVTIQWRNTMKKLYFIMHHLTKVLKLNGSLHSVSWVSALGCSSCGLQLFTVCMLPTADSAETKLDCDGKFFSSDGVNTSVIKFSWCSSMPVSLISFLICAVSLIW